MSEKNEASVQSVVHTPGPWRQGGVKEISPTGRCREIVADDGRVGLVYGTTDEDCKANARLVEAAPEMLYCLQRLSPVVNDYDFRCSPEGKVLSDRINALLAKVV